MGVNYLSKRLRDAKQTPHEFANDKRLSGKRIGVDASVVMHKALSSQDGASYFHIKPATPNSELIERCTRMCSWAKSNDCMLVVAIDGMYHPLKENVNQGRSEKRSKAKVELDKVLSNISSKAAYERDRVFKKMKAAVFVSDTVVSTAIDVFRKFGMEVYGAPYEADFQLVYWELVGFTHGTYTIDSDLYAMGCKMVIDLLNFGSAKGKCVVILREEVQGNIMDGSDKWSDHETILYAALSGCDFVKRLKGAKTKAIEQLMKDYKNSNNKKSLVELLNDFAKGQIWPSGQSAEHDYADQVSSSVALMT